MSEGKPQESERGRAPRGGVRREDAEALIGQRLGRFKVLGHLGEGAMATVVLAEDVALQRRVALKLLARFDGDPQKRTWIEQFIREARAAARLVHPHITQIFEVGTAKGVYFIAMEHLEHGTLENLVRRNGPLPARRVCEMGAQAADALAYAHDAGLIHRDIKPANLLLTDRGHIKIADFGFVEFTDPRETFHLPFKVVGTPFYMAPEVGEGHCSPQSDLFALAAVLWYALTGRPPYALKAPVDVLKVGKELSLPDLKALRPDVSPQLTDFLGRALAHDPAERPPDAGAMAEQLRELATQMGAASAPPVPAGAAEGGGDVEDELSNLSRAWMSASMAGSRTRASLPKRRRKRRDVMRLLVAGIALVLVVAGIVAYVLWSELGTGSEANGADTAGNNTAPAVTDGEADEPMRDATVESDAGDDPDGPGERSDADSATNGG